MRARFFLCCALLLFALGQSLWAIPTLGKDKIYIRFTNCRPDAAAIMVRLNVVPNHYALIPPDETKELNWSGKTVYVGRDGAGADMDAARYLKPGETSPWVDVGQYMNPMGTRSYQTYLSPVLCAVTHLAAPPTGCTCWPRWRRDRARAWYGGWK